MNNKTETRWAPAHENPANDREAAELRAVANVIDSRSWAERKADPQDPVTCSQCWRTWDAYLYPTPSDRCPWEYDHEYDEVEAEPHTSDTVVPIIASALRQRFGHPPLGDPWTWDEVVEDVLDIVAWALQENGAH